MNNLIQLIMWISFVLLCFCFTNQYIYKLEKNKIIFSFPLLQEEEIYLKVSALWNLLSHNHGTEFVSIPTCVHVGMWIKAWLLLMVYFMGATTLRVEFEAHIYISHIVILGFKVKCRCFARISYALLSQFLFQGQSL